MVLALALSHYLPPRLHMYCKDANNSTCLSVHTILDDCSLLMLQSEYATIV